MRQPQVARDRKRLTLTSRQSRRLGFRFVGSSEEVERADELRLEDLQADDGAATVDTSTRPRSQASRSTGRRPLPEHLPREDVVHQPDDACCPQCGGTPGDLGEDVSEQLDYVPGHWRVIGHRRLEMACTCCDCIVQAAAPSQPIELGMPGPGLLAHVLVAKFCDHLPLYRQSVIYARDGVKLSRSILADWVGQCSALLRPLVEVVRPYVIAASKIHADDTPVPVLEPGNGQTRTARLWTYVGMTGQPARRTRRWSGLHTVPQGLVNIHRPI